MNAYMNSAALAAVIAGAVLLSGCAVTTDTRGTDAKPQPTAIQPAGAPATEAPTAAESKSPKAGEKVPEADRKAVEEANPNISAYWMGGDEYVAVEADKPLPKRVQKAENKRAAGNAKNYDDSMKMTVADYTAIANDAKARTGKKTLVIFEIQGALLEDRLAGFEGSYRLYVIAGGGEALLKLTEASKTVDGSVRRAEAFVDKQDNPAEWAIAHP